LPLESPLSYAYGPRSHSGIEVNEGRERTWGACVCTLEGHSDVCCCVAFSPDGERLVSGSADGTIRLWNIQTGALLQVMDNHSECVRSVVYLPDGTLIVSGSNSSTTVRIWSAVTGLQVGIYTDHLDRALCITFSPDGQYVASGGENN
jgi:WD40 repeat protein